MIQATPDQKRTSAKIDHAACEAFIHWHVSLGAERISGIKTSSIPSNSLLVAQSNKEGLTKGNPAIFHGVMRVNFEVARAAEVQINHRMLGKKAKHVIKKRDPATNRGFAGPIDTNPKDYTRFACGSFDLSLTGLHLSLFNQSGTVKTKGESRKGQTGNVKM
jgi:hypothetical protein